MKFLITAIDLSEQKVKRPKKVFAIVSIEEAKYKELRKKIRGKMKHYRLLPSKRKPRYLAIFESRFERIKHYLRYYGFFFDHKDALFKLDELSLRSRILIIDDKLYSILKSRYKNVVDEIYPEGKCPNYLRELFLIADNLANLVRYKITILKDWRKALKQLEKLKIW